MAMSISIHPVSTYLDMYGEPDATSAFSLSGVVTISVSSSYSLFERRRAAKLLLQSLSLTFEGQSEIYTHATGYTGMRLCLITRELAPSEPVEFTNEGHEEESEPCQWNIVFNIPIPGWLPASSSLGLDEIGIRYSLYATAKFINLDVEPYSASWSFATLCAPFRSRTRYAEASKGVVIRRYVLPPQVDRPAASINYLVNSHSSSENTSSSRTRIPAEILSKIQVLASVPDVIDIDDNAVPITIRLRTKNLDSAQCKRVQITEVGINILQQERCRYRPSRSFLFHYPVPPLEMQPPTVPLRDPHPVSAIYDVGLYIGKDHSESICRTFSLLPENETGKYKLMDDNYAFASDAEQGENPTWYTMETRIPFAQANTSDLGSETEEWAGPATIRPSSSSPLYSVSHDVAISLTFAYDIPGSDEMAWERLNFDIPVTFGRYLSLLPNMELDLKPADEADINTQTAPRSPLPFSNLPSYSQLYDSNGDRKIDFSTPLPLYTPHPETSLLPEGNGVETSTSVCDEEKPSAAAHFVVGVNDHSMPPAA